jgi:hypothetical protein
MIQEKRIEDCTIYSDGRCYNHKRRRWSHEKNIPDNNGYIRISGTHLHRMIAEAFLPNPARLPFINHKDGNKLNNDVSNLEWCTHKHNVKHAYEIGLYFNEKGEKARNVKLKELEVLAIRKLYAEGRTQQSLAEQFNIGRGTIGKITTRRIWTHI